MIESQAAFFEPTFMIFGTTVSLLAEPFIGEVLSDLSIEDCVISRNMLHYI
jgi:hypothetical protein